MTHEPRYIPRGATIVTTRGEIVRRPKVLPQERYRVDATDGKHYQAYIRAGWLWRRLHGVAWRCMSGVRVWSRPYDVWRWIEGQCVHRDDWHGVGYARWMQKQTAPHDEVFGFDLEYFYEPPWVFDLYDDGPPDWS